MSSENQAEQLFYKSLAYIESKDYKTALELLLNANKLFPNRKSILCNLCKIYNELGDLKNLKKFLNILLFYFKEDIEVRYIEILYNINIGKLNLAKLQIENLEELKNSDTKLRLEFLLYQKLYDHNNILSILKKLILLNPENLNDLKTLIFMNLYSNPFSYANFQLLTNQFKEKVKISNKIFQECLSHKFNNKLNLGFIINRYPYDPAFNQIKGVVKELKNFHLILHAFIDKKNIEVANYEDLKTFFHQIHDISKLSINDASKLIVNQNIDFLFDLSGYSADSRVEILMFKPARKIISWAGWLHDSLIEQIDYIILDKFCDSGSLDNIQKEKKLFIDDIWSPYYIPENENADLKSKSKYKDSFNYGSFANPLKYNEEVIKIWSKILKNSNNTKLIICYSNLGYFDCAEHLYCKFNKFGVSRDRIIMSGLKSKKEILSDYNEIDLALDTFPYCGMTTSFDAVRMNVPLLTLKGNKIISNCGYSINKNLDLDFLISFSTEEYLKKAIFLSANMEEIDRIKKKIELKKNNSLLFNSKKFAEKLFQKLYNIKNETKC